MAHLNPNCDCPKAEDGHLLQILVPELDSMKGVDLDVTADSATVVFPHSLKPLQVKLDTAVPWWPRNLFFFFFLTGRDVKHFFLQIFVFRALFYLFFSFIFYCFGSFLELLIGASSEGQGQILQEDPSDQCDFARGIRHFPWLRAMALVSPSLHVQGRIWWQCAW